METGGERTFALTLPPDFPQEAYRGEEVDFTVKVTEVYNYVKPELDDDLARVAGNYESFEELEQEIREALRTAAEQQAEREYAEQVVADIAEQAHVEYPPVMLERELDELVREVEQSVRREARLSLEDYLRIQGKSLEQFREELTPRAEERLKRGLVLSHVVAQENLEIGEGEVATHIDEVSAPWGSRAEQVRATLETDSGRTAVSSRLLVNKAVERLVTIAKGEFELAPADEPESEEVTAEETAEPEGDGQKDESPAPAVEAEEEA